MSDEAKEPTNEQEFDISQQPQMEHRFDKIIGNQLVCTLHDQSTSCPVIFVKPTEVLVKGEDGTLHLFDQLSR